MDLYQRNDSAIAALETHLRQYGYAGSFQRSIATLPTPLESPCAAMQSISNCSSAMPAEGRLIDDFSVQSAAGSPIHRSRSMQTHCGLTTDAPALLPLDNVLPERDAAAHLRTVARKGGEPFSEGAWNLGALVREIFQRWRRSAV